VLEREGGIVTSQSRRPVVGDRGEVAVEGRAQLADRVRQRVVEVAVAAVAEAVAAHVDRRAEAPAVEEIGQLRGLTSVQERLGDRMALVVELLAQSFPVERVDPVADAGCRHVGHMDATARLTAM
jgi:hypothetical protein